MSDDLLFIMVVRWCHRGLLGQRAMHGRAVCYLPNQLAQEKGNEPMNSGCQEEYL